MENPHDSTRPESPEKFHFKYIAEEELLQIVRKVRREKQKEKDALLWKRFVEEKEKKFTSLSRNDNFNEDLPSSPLCQNCTENIRGIDERANNSVKSESYQESLLLNVDEPSMPVQRLVPQDSVIVTARDSGYIQRITLLRHRISLALDSIQGMIQCQPTEPDGPDDLERRKTRITEFLSRFSRNYLFQFQRQVAELRKQILCLSPTTPKRRNECHPLMQKLVSAHQIALQSLQVYLTQIPASLQVTNIFGKLRDLLHHLCDLSTLKSLLETQTGINDGFDNSGDTDEVYTKCKELVNALEDRNLELEDITLSARASSLQSARCSLNSHNPRIVHRGFGSMRQGSWKKSSVHLAHSKFGLPPSPHSSVTARFSSTGVKSNEEKQQSMPSSNQCCHIELKDIIAHMHDVLCNKVAPQKTEKRRKHQSRKHMPGNKRVVVSQKPLTEVQNLSKNVQLVITRHCESEVSGVRDAATDTIDLDEAGMSHINSTGARKAKRVGWASPGESTIEDSDEQLRSIHKHTSLQYLNEQSHGDTGSRLSKTSAQHVMNYRRRFRDYNSQVQNPLIQRWCDDLLDGVFQEISEELEPSFLLEKMYHLEFKDYE